MNLRQLLAPGVDKARAFEIKLNMVGNNFKIDWDSFRQSKVVAEQLANCGRMEPRTPGEVRE